MTKTRTVAFFLCVAGWAWPGAPLDPDVIQGIVWGLLYALQYRCEAETILRGA